MSRLLTSVVTIGALCVPLTLSSAGAQTYGASSRYDQSAQSYEQCVREQRNRQVAGAVIGGLLGAVIGAELHDEHQDANRGRHYRSDRHYRGRHHYRDRHDRRGRHHRRGRDYDYEEGNDGAVVTGGAVGALAGAAIAGGQDCDRHNRYGTGYGYDRDYRYDTDYGYDDGYGYESDYRYDEGYGYDQRSSGDVLLGGEDYSRDSRTYRVESRPTSSYGQACRTMQSGSGARVLMCQGSDGIWRPADR